MLVESNCNKTRLVKSAAFKLKEAINVDKLIEIQHFDYKRKIKKNNVVKDQVIKCKIKGLRSDASNLPAFITFITFY